jgi:2-amino-4-hydroxy-6-hydroxymethyldihydropteridine diphosphokinase
MRSSSKKSELHTVFLSLGTNKGNRESNLVKAIALLKEILKDQHPSSVYRTEPMYVTDQPEFLNMVVTGKTELPAEEFFRKTQAIETDMGRDRTREQRMGQRIMDIDLLLFDSIVLSQVDLQIPHPRLRERRFVLVPLLEIAPDLADPRSGTPFSRFLADLPDQGVYIYGPINYSDGNNGNN